MSNLESIIKADSQNSSVYIYALPFLKKYYKIRDNLYGLS